MIIYKISNTINKKSYVGMTIGKLEKRILQHFNIVQSGTCLLSKAIKRYGSKKFYYEILDTASTREELKFKEIFWIDKLNTITPNGYNYHKGGQGGPNNGTIARERSVKCLNTGEIFTSITRASDKLGINRTNISEVCRGKNDSTKGFIFEYVNKNLKEKATITRTKRIKVSSKNFKIAMNKFNTTKRVKIKCISLNKYFNSMTEAALETGVPIQCISLNCRGSMDSAGGLRFEFVGKNKKALSKKDSKIRHKNTKINRLMAREKMGICNRKKVKCLTTGEVFNSIIETAKKIDVDPSAISQALRGLRKNVNGLTFIYGDKNE